MSLSDLAPIEHETLADVVLVRIRDAIVQGTFSPGQRLTEPMLARRLCVSRSPVREALQRLRGQGLVVGAGGHYVWQPTVDDVDEVFSLYSALATLAAEWAIRNRRLSDRDLTRLQAMVEELQDLAERPDVLSLEAVVDADERFYGMICRKSGHSRLIGLWSQLAAQRYVLMFGGLRDVDMVPVALRLAADHQAMLDSLRCGDIERVRHCSDLLTQDRVDKIKASLATSPAA